MCNCRAIVILLACLYEGVLSAELYDVYFGKPLAGRRKDFLEAANGTALPQCTVLVQKCNVTEGRRVDGTCNNLRHPSRASSRSPLLRLLPPLFGPNNDIRSAKSGEPLPLARRVRTQLFSDGLVTSPPFSQLASHYFLSTTVDLSSLLDLLTYIVVSDCCLGNIPNRVNPRCIPIEVPADDPYLRLTGIRCLNLTRSNSYQEAGCIPDTLPRDRINPATPLLDLSVVYGVDPVDEKRTRLFIGGRLRAEQRNNRIFPPGNSIVCLTNKAPIENRCYEYGDQLGGNALPGINLYALWFYREHNRIADRLAKVNPCWDDKKLFEVARSINIAQNFQIYYYELIPALIGKQNALKNGIIFDTKGYVNDYDERLEPSTYVEFLQGTRWFHTFQDARANTYTQKGKYTGFLPIVDFPFRTGILELNNTIEQLTQGSFRQESAKFDHIFDPDLAERVYGGLQRAADLISIDIMRSRDNGLRTYNDYRQLCGMPRARSFKDFLDVIDVSKVETISRLYEEPDDVDIITGIYSERFIEDGWTGPTLYCIMVRQWLLWRRSDRFFYEHGDQPTSFTLPQLNEIRKATISRVVCDNGDGVRKIQPKAFYRPMLGNPIIPCENIEGIEFRAWRDPKCYKENEKPESGANGQSIFGYGNYARNAYFVGPNNFGYGIGQYQEENNVDTNKKEETKDEKKKEDVATDTNLPEDVNNFNKSQAIEEPEVKNENKDITNTKQDENSEKAEESGDKGEENNNEREKEEGYYGSGEEQAQEMYGFNGYVGYENYG